MVNLAFVVKTIQGIAMVRKKVATTTSKSKKKKKWKCAPSCHKVSRCHEIINHLSIMIVSCRAPLVNPLITRPLGLRLSPSLSVTDPQSQKPQRVLVCGHASHSLCQRKMSTQDAFNPQRGNTLRAFELDVSGTEVNA